MVVAVLCFIKVQKDGKVVAYKTAYFGQVSSEPANFLRSHALSGLLPALSSPATVQVHVGGPEPQSFTVVFDTGLHGSAVSNSSTSRHCRSERGIMYVCMYVCMYVYTRSFRAQCHKSDAAPVGCKTN